MGLLISKSIERNRRDDLCGGKEAMKRLDGEVERKLYLNRLYMCSFYYPCNEKANKCSIQNLYLYMSSKPFRPETFSRPMYSRQEPFRSIKGKTTTIIINGRLNVIIYSPFKISSSGVKHRRQTVIFR